MTDYTDDGLVSRFGQRRTGIKTADRLVDQAIEDAANQIAEESGFEDFEVEVAEIEEIESDGSEPKPLSFIGQEPTSKSLKAKMVKKLGLNKSMTYTPWKGKDMWTCSKCKWTTFENRRAKRHYCEN